jgi:hypothetical protein
MDASDNSVSQVSAERLSTELAAASKTVEQLTVAMHSNRDIGAAIGILMAQRRMTRQRAFDLLRQASQRMNVKLRDLALDVIDTGTLPESAEDVAPLISSRPVPRRPRRSSPRPEPCLSLRGRVTAALLKADLRDAAAAVRSSASRARGKAARARHTAALLRAASGDVVADAHDRQCESDDRNAEAIDNIWTGRDVDEAAGDRALLSEATQQFARGDSKQAPLY